MTSPPLAMAAQGVGSVVILVIGLAFLAGLRALLAQIARYKHERQWTKSARESIDGAVSEEGSFDSGVPVDSLTGHFIQSVQSEVPVREAADLAHQRDEASFSTVFANTILSLLLVAGLAGTLFSFKDALGSPPQTGKLGGTIDNKSIQDYALTVYHGIRGAFWPSVAGILSTIILYGIRGIRANRIRDLLFIELEELGYRLIKRARIQLPSSSQEVALIAATTKLTEAASQIQTAAQGIKDTFSKAGDLCTALGTATEGMKNSALELQKPANVFLKAFDNVKSPVAKKLGELADMIERFQLAVGQEGEDRTLHREEMTKIQAAHSDHLKLLSDIVSRFETASKSQADSGAKVEAMGQTLDASIKAQQAANREVVEKMAKVVTDQSSAGSKLVAELQTSLIRIRAEAVDEVAKAGKASAEAISPALTLIAEASIALRETGVTFAQQLDSASTKAGVEISKGLDTGRESMRPVLETMTGVCNDLTLMAGHLKNLSVIINTTLEKLADISPQLSALPTVAISLDRAMNNFQQRAEQNTKELQQAFKLIADWEPPGSPTNDHSPISRWRTVVRKLAFWRR